MSWYKDKQELNRKAWETATDAGDTKEADERMTDFVNYSEFVDNPELQAKSKS